MLGRVGTLGTWRGKVRAEVPTGPDFLPAGREAVVLDSRQGASPGGSGFLGAGGISGRARGQLTWTGDMEDGVLKEGFLVKRVSALCPRARVAVGTAGRTSAGRGDELPLASGPGSQRLILPGYCGSGLVLSGGSLKTIYWI